MHGSIKLIEENCTSCMMCARVCPTWCIQIESHTEADPDSPPGPRQRKHHVLDEFTIDWTLCMYCGLCVSECPFDALAWADARVAASEEAGALQHGREKLR